MKKRIIFKVIVILMLMIVVTFFSVYCLRKEEQTFLSNSIIDVKNESDNYAVDYEDDWENYYDDESKDIDSESINDEIPIETGENKEPVNISDMYRAIQEVEYSYYMRGKNIQYNSNKGVPSWYSPEEATSQNVNYMTCSVLPKNVYNELLDIRIPSTTDRTLKYGRENIGKPEVIAYGSKVGSNLEMNFYNPSADKNYNTITNPSLEQIIPYLQIRRRTYLYWTCNYGI